MYPDQSSSIPDKVPEVKKAEAHIKFQEIAFAYAILSSPARRARYNRTGQTDTVLASLEDEDDFDWTDFYRAQFAEVVSAEKLAEFRASYKNSDQERDDLLASFETNNGDMDMVFEEVMLSNPLEDDSRFRKIIDEAIESGDVDPYKAYVKESQQKKKKRMAKAKREEQEARELAKELGIDDRVFGTNDEASSSSSQKRKRGGRADSGEDHSALAQIIQQRAKARSEGFLERLEAKYGQGQRKSTARTSKKSRADPVAETKAR